MCVLRVCALYYSKLTKYPYRTSHTHPGLFLVLLLNYVHSNGCVCPNEPNKWINFRQRRNKIIHDFDVCAWVCNKWNINILSFASVWCPVFNSFIFLHSASLLLSVSLLSFLWHETGQQKIKLFVFNVKHFEATTEEKIDCLQVRSPWCRFELHLATNFESICMQTDQAHTIIILSAVKNHHLRLELNKQRTHSTHICILFGKKVWFSVK